ncbi:MAG: ABC transporter ATP-binding protein [Flavobacteriaceae bacterium]
MISAHNLSKSYGDLTVLNRVSLSIRRGEIVAIVGPSGAGKTTLLQILGTLTSPDSRTDTSLTIQDTDILKLDTKQLAQFRNKSLGFIFQFHELLEEFSGLENVMMPALIQGRKRSEVKTRALELLTLLGLDDRQNHKPNSLSGGEQQRVAVARALMNKPAIIFADEPSGNLDSQNAEHLHQLFFKLRDELGQTFVIVTHNKTLAEMADRTIVLKDGEIIQ